MQFGKEEIQKLSVNVLLLVAMLYAYKTMFREPLMRKRDSVRASIAAVEAEIETAEKQVRKTRGLEVDAKRSEEIFLFFKQYIRDAAPISWFPPMINGFFDRHGLESVSTRLMGSSRAPGPGLEKFVVTSWSTEIPKAGFLKFGLAIAALENEYPMLEVQTMRIYSPSEDPEFQHMSLGISAILTP